MLVLVQIDISKANIALFDEYEARVLELLGVYGATLVERLRAADGNSEVHLLDFPDERAFQAFRDDPTRAELQDLWRSCAATSMVTEMVRLAGPDA
jgi:hypothetical protein